MVSIQIREELSGSILDVGGGGEGVIGRAYGRRVVAIDTGRRSSTRRRTAVKSC